jgi:addiction module RelE/StbE family toxin
MKIVFHRHFKKLHKKQSKKIQQRFGEQFAVFKEDPYNPILNNHALRGELVPARSINITGDIRAWYVVIDEKIIFLKIGSHSELYG